MRSLLILAVILGLPFFIGPLRRLFDKLTRKFFPSPPPSGSTRLEMLEGQVKDLELMFRLEDRIGALEERAGVLKKRPEIMEQDSDASLHLEE